MTEGKKGAGVKHWGDRERRRREWERWAEIREDQPWLMNFIPFLLK